MIYRHTPRFQIVLHQALNLQRAAGMCHPNGTPCLDSNGVKVKYSHDRMSEDVSREKEIYISPELIRRFSASSMIPSFTDEDIHNKPIEECAWRLHGERKSRALWDYLSRRDFVRKVFARDNKTIIKKNLFSMREAASVFISMYDVDESHVSDYSVRGLTQVADGEITSGSLHSWIAYKLSTRTPGFVVKSRFTVTNFQDEFFEIDDMQIASGLYDAMPTKFSEESIGFGFMKSRKLWVFMRENSQNQIRVACFDNIIVSHLSKDSFRENRISVLYGHLSEADKKFTYGFYPMNIVLVDPSVDKAAWKQEKRDVHFEEYDLDREFDCFPFTSEEEQQRRFNKIPFVPNFVREHLLKPRGIQAIR